MRSRFTSLLTGLRSRLIFVVFAEVSIFFLLTLLSDLLAPRGFRPVHFCASRLTFGSAFSKLSSSTFDGKLVVRVVSVVALRFTPGEKKGELDIHWKKVAMGYRKWADNEDPLLYSYGTNLTQEQTWNEPSFLLVLFLPSERRRKTDKILLKSNLGS